MLKVERCGICEPQQPDPDRLFYSSDLWNDDWGPEDLSIPVTSACESCISDGKAIRGDPELQDAGGFAPLYYAYSDRLERCVHCGVSFVFSANEQKYWYEDLAFYTRSEPTGCLDCRRRRRRYRDLNLKIAKKLEEMEPRNWKMLEELGALYLEFGARGKAIETLRQAKNLCEDGASKARLLSAITNAGEAPVPTWPDGQFAALKWLGSKTDPHHFRAVLSRARSILSEEGGKVADELYARWLNSRYGKVKGTGSKQMRGSRSR